MIIDCISDLHGFYPELEGGDLLIIAGDHTKKDRFIEHSYFWHWLRAQKYKKQIFIAGNHDNWLQEHRPVILEICPKAQYLCDSGTEFEGLKIWGSPWTTKFKGMNPHCMAFTVDTDEELAEKWNLIPDDTDILITHSPREDCLDTTIDGRSVGSFSLVDAVVRCEKLKLHVYGHVHEAYGQDEYGGIKFVNASHVNERYQPVNKPIRVTL
jgi:Icc-related predicted phosphoesterase